MVEIINGPNGKYVLDITLIAIFCLASIKLYSMRHGYNSSIAVGNVCFSFTKN